MIYRSLRANLSPPLHPTFLLEEIMNSLISLATRVRDPVAVTAACRHLSLPAPVQDTVQFPGGEATGLVVKLPGWNPPIVIDTDAGMIHYDIDSKLQRDSQQLNRFLRAYALERVKWIARQQGVALSESSLPDGSIQLQIRANK